MKKEDLKNLYQQVLVDSNNDSSNNFQRRIIDKKLSKNLNCYLGVQKTNKLPYFSVESNKNSFKSFKEYKTSGIGTNFISTSQKDVYMINLKNEKYINNFYYLLLEILDIFSMGKEKLIELKNFQEKVDQWIVFLKNNKLKKLSKEELIGLFGELFFLKELINISPNNALTLWVGPYGASQDFENSNKFVEVKTTFNRKTPFIHIASEFQLDPFNKELLLLSNVIIKEDKENGYLLTNIISDLKKVMNKSDINLFNDLLRALRLNVNELTIYKEKFSLVKMNIYEINNNFPMISFSKLNHLIFNVRYNLLLEDLDEFLINKKEAIRRFVNED